MNKIEEPKYNETKPMTDKKIEEKPRKKKAKKRKPNLKIPGNPGKKNKSKVKKRFNTYDPNFGYKKKEVKNESNPKGK
jgi:hypothetical protein